MHRYGQILDVPWRVKGQLARAKLLEHEQRWGEAMAVYEQVARQAVPEAKVAAERLGILAHATKSR